MSSSVTIKITADVISLQSQFAVARAETSALTSELNNLAKQAASTGMTDELKAQLTQASEAMLTAQNQSAALRAELKALSGTSAAQTFGSLTAEASKLAPLLGALGIGGGLGLAAFGLEEFGKNALESAANTQEMADRLGISVEDYQAYSYAARQAGVSTDDADMALQRFMANLGNFKETGTGPMALAFQKLGITIDELSGTPMETLIFVARKIDAMTDATEKAAAERDTFSRSGQAMNAVIHELATGAADVDQKLQDVKTSAADAGEALDPKLSKAAKDADIAMDSFGAKLKVVGGTYMIGFIETAKELGQAIAGIDWSNIGAIERAGAGIPTSPTPAAPKRPDMGPAPPAPTMITPHQPQPVAPTIDIETKGMVDAARQAADELAQIYEQTALRHIQSEQQANDAMLQLGNESVEQWQAQALKLNDDRYQAQMAGIRKKESADAGDKAKEAVDQAQALAAYQENEDRKTAITNEAAQKRNDITNKLAAETAAASIKAAQTDAATTAQLLAKELATYQITEAQKIAAMEAATQQQYNAEIAAAQKELAAITGNSATEIALRKKLSDQIVEAKREENEKMLGLDTQAAQNAVRTWQSILGPIESGFASMTSSLLSKNTSFSTASKQMLVQLASEYAATRIKVEFDWLEGQAAMALGAEDWANKSVLAWVASELGITTAQTASDATSLTTGAATASMLVLQAAAVGAANAEAATAIIPFIGPELAPAVGAATYLDIAKYATVASAAGGEWMVSGNEVPYRLHNREAVMPASVADPMRSFFSDPGNRPGANGAAGAGGRSGPDLHVHVHANDSKDVEQWLAKAGTKRAFQKFMRDGARNGFGK